LSNLIAEQIMTCALASCLLTLAVGAEPLNDAAQKELKKLEGEWVVQQIETKDAKQEPGADERMVLTIQGRSWTFGTFQKGEIVALDPNTQPKLLDLKSIRRGRPSLVNEAVYQIDGDILHICIYQGKDKKRPTNLKKPTEGDTVLWTLKRSKK
jgi:uncharacterized protein (TIGR03067 family)